MDVLSHFFIPYIAALWVLGLYRAPKERFVDLARRETAIAYAVVFGIGGFAPDIDPIFSWAKHFGSLYWLQHRGVSHTLFFAPFFAILCTFFLHALAVWRPVRFGRFRFRPMFAVVAAGGSLTHLVLDIFTYTGIPLLWPFSVQRVSFPFFHYIVLWMFPLTFLILALHLWGKLRPHHVARVGVVVIAALVVLAGVRVHYEPELPPGAEAYPRSRLLDWVVVFPDSEGYVAVLVEKGKVVERSAVYYPDRVMEGTESAVERARATAAYKGFRMGAFGPITVQSESVDRESVLVTFTDVAARYEAINEPRWTPTKPHEAWGYVSFIVRPDGIDVLHRGW